ncbi:hypothetical protein ABZZ74_47205 [Streptomyces sp. NPDC006476]|uniref:hypothetical protein n=1 Tax=Streptomyces sp. NPDC006476 TaxID=3157175 RepID=UPI0033B5289C
MIQPDERRKKAHIVHGNFDDQAANSYRCGQRLARRPLPHHQRYARSIMIADRDDRQESTP